MKINLNNNVEFFLQDQLTINEILKEKNYSFRLILVKLNNTLINKLDFDHTTVKDGDDLKIIHLMSGG
jgi:sulfur carrier protein